MIQKPCRTFITVLKSIESREKKKKQSNKEQGGMKSEKEQEKDGKAENILSKKGAGSNSCTRALLD